MRVARSEQSARNKEQSPQDIVQLPPRLNHSREDDCSDSRKVKAVVFVVSFGPIKPNKSYERDRVRLVICDCFVLVVIVVSVFDVV